MDRRNNAIGAAIGTSAGSFAKIEPAVRKRVLARGVQAKEPGRITWLASDRWRDGKFR